MRLQCAIGTVRGRLWPLPLVCVSLHFRPSAVVLHVPFDIGKKGSRIVVSRFTRAIVHREHRALFFILQCCLLLRYFPILYGCPIMEALSEPSGGDQNRGPRYNAVTPMFGAPAFAAVILRMFVRTGMIGSTGWDDVCICLAWVSNKFLDSYTLFAALRSRYRSTSRHYR